MTNTLRSVATRAAVLATAAASLLTTAAIAHAATTTTTNAVSQQATTPTAELGPGRTGTRDQVPWGNLRSGWRVLQPLGKPSVYLYDPEGGRYLITSSLPAHYSVVGWSHDGTTAALQAQGAWAGVLSLNLHTGTTGGYIPHANFMSFTRPDGTAQLVSIKTTNLTVQRYSRDGAHQFTYGSNVLAQDFQVGALYTPDGAAFVARDGEQSGLYSNSTGQTLQGYAIPPNYQQCVPINGWNPGIFLELCLNNNASKEGLFIQAMTSGSRTAIAANATDNFDQAWPLSNGTVLVQRENTTDTCSRSNYLIREKNGTLVPAKITSVIGDNIHVVNVAGDLATFAVCGHPNASNVVDNLLTGATYQLNTSNIVSFS